MRKGHVRTYSPSLRTHLIWTFCTDSLRLDRSSLLSSTPTLPSERLTLIGGDETSSIDQLTSIVLQRHYYYC